jgi:hypothetical protein
VCDDGKEPEGIRKARVGLEAEGWHVVPAAGSLGTWDLVALHPEHGVKLLRVLQCAPTQAELDMLADFRCHPTWLRYIVIYPERPAGMHGIASKNAIKRGR